MSPKITKKFLYNAIISRKPEVEIWRKHVQSTFHTRLHIQLFNFYSVGGLRRSFPPF